MLRCNGDLFMVLFICERSGISEKGTLSGHLIVINSSKSVSSI